MIGRNRIVLAVLASFFVGGATSPAADPSAPERGKQALLGRAFNPATISFNAYRSAWRQWDDDLKEPPAHYTAAFMERYGLHAAPYPNNGYPMGLREGRTLFGAKALSTDCLLCHGGSICGQSYVGLGNTALDAQLFLDEMSAADGRSVKTPFRFCNVRGTVEAGGMAVFLFGLREPDLKMRGSRLDLDLHDDLCEDTPAWWLLKKKKTMYHTGGGDAGSVRSLMQFMLSPLNTASVFDREEATFRDVQAYLLTLEPPKYPFPVDQGLARTGKAVFEQTCSRCHGTYGANWTYPNKIVPLEVIGTDSTRYYGITETFGRYYRQTWFGKERRGWLADDYPARATAGYQAPPLDGIWATAPYFHNGSVPTVYHVLNSKARPALFTRSYRTGKEDYDPVRLGWRVQLVDARPDPKLPAWERRKVYDTTQPGSGNGGHTFGDHLTEGERMAVIEYLKTL